MERIACADPYAIGICPFAPSTIPAAGQVVRALMARLPNPQTPAALHLNDASYRELFESNPQPMWVYDLETLAFLTVNGAATAHYGYSREEFLGMTIRDIRPAEDISRLIENVSNIRSGLSQVEVWRHRRKDRSDILVEITAHSMTFGDRQARLVLAHDVTARHFAEEKLRLSEQNLAITLQSIGDAVIATDAGGLVTRMNTAAERMTGWTWADATGRPLTDVFRIINAQTRALAVNPVQLVMERGDVVGLANHTALIARDGREYQIFDSAAPIRDSGGAILGVVLVFSDVTEAYQIRQELARTVELLERTGELAKVGGWELDLRTRKLTFSREAFRINELEPTQSPQMGEGFDLYPAEVRPLIQTAIKDAIENGKPFDLELPRLTAKGRSIWVRTQGTAVMEEGKAIKLLGAFQDITERKQAEVALQESEASLAAAQARAHLGSWELNLLTHTGTWSHELFRLYHRELSLGPPTYEGFLDLIHPDDRAAVVAQRASVPELTAPQTIEYRTHPALGPIRVLSNTLHVIRDAKGAAVRMAGTTLDITERRQSQEALRQSEERFRSSFNSAGIGMAVCALDGRWLQVNPALCDIVGYTESHMLGKTFQDLTYPDDLEADLTNMQSLLSGTKRSFHMEKRYIHREGHTVWINLSVSLVRDAAGTPLHTVAHMEDISLRKQLEQELRHSEERFRRIVQTAEEGIWEINVDAKTSFVNPKMAQMLGYTPEDMLGRALTDFMDNEGRAIAEKNIERRRQGIAEQHDFKFMRKDGSEFWGVVATNPILDAQGGYAGALAMITDITTRKQSEEALRIAASAFDSQQGMFVTNASWVILQVNKAFTEITGYSKQEAVGLTPHVLLRSGRHDADFYSVMTDSLERTGSWQGEIWDRRKNGEIYPQWLSVSAVKNAEGVVTHYVDAFTDITSRKAAEDQIQSLAFFDPLTGLPNRRLLMDRLKQAMATGARREKNGALLFVDLDNFKNLNDTLGHDTGDLLLQQVAQRLTTCIREGDTVARLGGDEFVVMLEDLSENELEAAAQAENVGEKIHAALNQIYKLASYVHHSTPSIGVTLFGKHQESIEEPLKRADLAMYQAKAAGRNTLRFFDPQMQAVVTARASMEAGLREALGHDQFLLHYQAQVKNDRQVTGVEALVRWNHPQRGLVSPAEFIPLAEDTGLILLLGSWVLETACTQLANWADRPDMAHLTIAVNVSPRQFHQSDFVDQVLAVLERTRANPQRLKLELTESMLVSNVEDVIGKMTVLKAKGVGFSLDDFGTGYSSLSYLKRLPLDQLKIDQGFVRDVMIDPNDAAISKMVIALADSLGLEVIAEGVETGEQRDFLARHGCHAYQGYLFSRPLPLLEFEAFITRK